MAGMLMIWRWPKNASTVNKLRKMVFFLFFLPSSMTASRELISNLTGNKRKKGQTSEKASQTFLTFSTSKGEFSTLKRRSLFC